MMITSYRAAQIIGISRNAVYERIKSGKFPKGKMMMHKGKERIMFDEDDIYMFKSAMIMVQKKN